MTLRKGDVLGILLIFCAIASVASVAVAIINLRRGHVRLDARGVPCQCRPDVRRRGTL